MRKLFFVLVFLFLLDSVFATFPPDTSCSDDPEYYLKTSTDTGQVCLQECTYGQRTLTQMCELYSACVKVYCNVAWKWECKDFRQDCTRWIPWTDDCDTNPNSCTQSWCRSNSSVANAWIYETPTKSTCCGDDAGETLCAPIGLGACVSGKYHIDADNSSYACAQCTHYGAISVWDEENLPNRCCGDDTRYEIGQYISFILGSRIANQFFDFRAIAFLVNDSSMKDLGPINNYLYPITGFDANSADVFFIRDHSPNIVFSFSPTSMVNSADDKNDHIYAKRVKTDDPDESEKFCRGVTGTDHGCPIGRFTEEDESGQYSLEDTRENRDWVESSLGCCGDDWGDEGLIVLSNNTYYLCDDSLGQLPLEWRRVVLPGQNLAGRIYSIQTNPGSFGTLQRGTVEDYDVLATSQADFLACDLDNSLPAEYKITGTFADKEYCTGDSGAKCTFQADSDYLCYDFGREQIAECFAPRGDIHTGDDISSLNAGEAIPNPFSKGFPAYIIGSLTPEPDAVNDLSLTFTEKNQYFAPIPIINNWSDYEYLSFDMHFDRPENSTQLFVRIKNSGEAVIDEPVLDFATIEDGKDYHVIIPGIGLSNITEITFISQAKGIGKVKFNNFLLSGGDMKGYYCSYDKYNESDWISDLDLDLYSNGTACKSASPHFYWTGSRCCGDDYTTVNQGTHSEYYRDVYGNCWGSQVEEIGAASNGTILSFANNFYSCFAPDNVKNMRSTVTGELMVNESQVCETHGFYFCSNQLRRWSNEASSFTKDGAAIIRTGDNRTELKYSQDGSSAECCHPDDCWNGSKCVPSQDIVELPYGIFGSPDIETAGEYEGFRCVNGEWVESGLKWDWIDALWGFCDEETQCLFDEAGCVPSGWYSRQKVMDSGIGPRDVSAIYCLDGDWTSRTKLLAQEMLNIRSDDFIVDCGQPDEVLNYYMPKTGFAQIEEFENIAVAPELNHFCVLSYDDNIVIGTTYNPMADADTRGTDLRIVLSNSFNVQGFSVENCEGDLAENRFHDCGNGVWFNNATLSIIYDPKNEIDLDGNIFTGIYDYLVGFIRGLFGMRVPVTAGEQLLLFANRTKMFNNIYVSKHGDKEIKAVVELKQLKKGQAPAQILTANYEGFDTSICESVYAYTGRGYAVCSETEEGETVIVLESALFDVPKADFKELVEALTRKTRVE